MKKEEQIRKGSFLPYGDNIRVLLSHAQLTSSNHKVLLNKKGIFLGDYDKNVTIPTYMKLLLDPSEFQEMVEMQSFKEDKEKYRTLKLPWNTDVDLLKSIPENFNINKLVNESTSYKPTYKVIGSPKFKRIDGNPNKIELEFKIERENNTKGWDERKTQHSGSLTLEKTEKGDIQLITTKTHTAKETDELGEKILKALKGHYKEKKFISKEDDFERILFNHFTNKNRINFLFGLTSSFGPLEFEKLTDLSVSPDEVEKPPAEFREFLNGINNLKIHGTELQTHILIAKSEFHDKLVFSSVTLRYRFRTSEGDGFCTVELAFSDYEDRQKKDAEFQFYIQSVVPDKAFRQSANKQKIRKIVNIAIDEEKRYLYELYKN